MEPEAGATPGDQTSADEWASKAVSHLAYALPFATLTSDVQSIKAELRTHLPTYETAYHLARAYFNNAAWM